MLYCDRFKKLVLLGHQIRGKLTNTNHHTPYTFSYAWHQFYVFSSIYNKLSSLSFLSGFCNCSHRFWLCGTQITKQQQVYMYYRATHSIEDSWGYCINVLHKKRMYNECVFESGCNNILLIQTSPAVLSVWVIPDIETQ